MSFYYELQCIEFVLTYRDALIKNNFDTTWVQISSVLFCYELKFVVFVLVYRGKLNKFNILTSLGRLKYL